MVSIIKPLKRPLALGDQVYQTLRGHLRDGTIGAGQPLQEVQLADKLGVSRTPVREALTRLASEGLLASDGRSFVVPALRDLGAAVVVPNYALAPKVGIPDITLQMVRAVAWSWRHARTLGGDARRIVVMGHSAGGQLAAMMLACAWNRFEPALPPRLVRAALGISGLYDLQPLLHTPSLQEVLRLTPRQVQAASPARLPAPAHGRLISAVGGDESSEYLRLNRLIQQAWGRERVPVAAVLPGLNHFSILDALVTPRSRLHRLAASLLA